MSNLVKCSSCNIVINEVLAFICNKIDVMDEESISRICVTAFSDSEIVGAKNLLFESIPSEKRKKLRKRQGKTVRNIEDIICLLKETDPEDIPIFVARDLQKLPPVLFDHVDVTRILKDLLKMRSDIDRITNEYVTVKQLDALKVDVENLKTVSIVNNFQREEDRFCGVNMVRGTGLLKTFNYDSGPMGLPLMCSDNSLEQSNNSLEQSHCVTSTPSQSSRRKQTVEGSNVKKQSHTAAPQTVEGSTVKEQCHAAAAVPLARDNQTAVRARVNNASCLTIQSSLIAPVTSSNSHTKLVDKNDLTKKPLSKIVQEGEWKAEVPNEEWILVQKKKLRNRFVGSRGKADVGLNSNFRAADVMIPLFIYNVSKETSVSDIENYVMKKSNMTVKVQKIAMKMTKDYSSFKLFVPKLKLNLFLSDDFWPEGVAYRRFIDFFRNKKDGDSST